MAFPFLAELNVELAKGNRAHESRRVRASEEPRRRRDRAFSAGQKYSLKLAAGEIADKWLDGSPITRAEFESVLAPHGPFEIDSGTTFVASGSLRR